MGSRRAGKDARAPWTAAILAAHWILQPWDQLGLDLARIKISVLDGIVLGIQAEALSEEPDVPAGGLR